MIETLRIVGVVAALVAVGCSSSSGDGGGGSGDIGTFCQKAVSCGVKAGATGATLTEASCEATLKGWVMPATCVPAMQKASCADITAPTPSQAFRDGCYPPCSDVGTATCSSDQKQATECQATGQVTVDCAQACVRAGKTFTGTCGLTYEGTTSGTGHPVCWCK